MEKIVPRHKVPLAQKMLVWRPCRSKVRERSGNFSLKVQKKIWKKNFDENFFSPKVLGARGRKCFQPLIYFFQKCRQFRSKSELTYKKKENNFFLRNCLQTHRREYIKSCQFFMEIAKKITGSLRKTIKITCFLKTCVFPQNFPPDSQNAFWRTCRKKIIKTVKISGSNSKKKIGNYKVSKKLFGRTPGDVGGSF